MPVPIYRVQIGVSDKDEPGIRRRAKHSVQIMLPENQLIVIAPPVEIFGPVEHRRGCVKGQ